MTRSIRTRLALLASASFVLALAAGVAAGGAAAKKSKSRTFEQQLAVNQAIPQDSPSGRSTPLISQVTVPKKFKKKVVGDVNVTSVQTTGAQPGAANDLVVRLIAPSGQAVRLWSGFGDQNLGPWTLDDDSPTSVCNAPASINCGYPFVLNQPFAGASNLAFTGNAGTGPLAAFDGSKMRGTWTFMIWDQSDAAQSSSLNQWGLRIKAAKPVKE